MCNTIGSVICYGSEASQRIRELERECNETNTLLKEKAEKSVRLEAENAALKAENAELRENARVRTNQDIEASALRDLHNQERLELYEERDALRAKLERAELNVEMGDKILRYVHFVLCGTDEIKTDLGNETQNAADAIKLKLERAEKALKEIMDGSNRMWEKGKASRYFEEKEK